MRSPWPHHHESVRHYRCGRNPSCRARENSPVANHPFAVPHPFLYGGEQLPELPGASKKLIADRKQTPPPLPLARRLPASRRRSATAARFAARHGAFGNAQQDAQLPRAIFPRVIGLVVEHTRYDSSRKRRQLDQPATTLTPRKDPRKKHGIASPSKHSYWRGAPPAAASLRVVRQIAVA